MFIVKPYGNDWLTVAPRLWVGFKRVFHVKAEKVGGLFNELEQIGYDRRGLDVVPKEGTTDRGYKSNETRDRAYLYDGLTGKHIGKAVRVMSDADETVLHELDGELDGLLALVDEKRKERREHVRAAWRRAKPAQYTELVELAEAEQRDIEERKAAARASS